MDICFRCRAVGGEARVNDDESLEVGWFTLDALPPLEDFALMRIDLAKQDGASWFEAPGTVEHRDLDGVPAEPYRRSADKALAPSERRQGAPGEIF